MINKWSKPAAALAIAAAALLCAPRAAFAEDNPLSFAMFTFLAGEWQEKDGPERISAEPFLGEGLLRFDIDSLGADGEAFEEFWIAGFDPVSRMLYMDVYSPGGYRSALVGKMIAPGRVWVFETPAGQAEGLIESRVVTKLAPDEIAIKFSLKGAGGIMEKYYVRVGDAEHLPEEAPG